MSKPKFSLVTIFIALTVLGIVCAALVRPSYAWANVVWTATVAALAGAVVGCFYGNRRSRAFCLGFACFGWLHMILSMAPWLESHTAALLGTCTLVDYAGELLGYDLHRGFVFWGLVETVSREQNTNYPLYQSLFFEIIGRSIMTVLAGLLGGFAGRFVARRETADDEREAV